MFLDADISEWHQPREITPVWSRYGYEHEISTPGAWANGDLLLECRPTTHLIFSHRVAESELSIEQAVTRSLVDPGIIQDNGTPKTSVNVTAAANP